MKRLTAAAITTLLLGSTSIEESINSVVTLLFEAVGKSVTSQFGLDVVGVGDQNRDGYDDVLVSARGEHATYLFHGGSPMDSLSGMMFTNTILIAAVDVNGDSAKDFVFGTFGLNGESFHSKLYYGGNLLDTIPDMIFMSSDTADGFGYPYSIGDFNGDGSEDFAIKALAFPDGNHQGKVRVYYGGSLIDSNAAWIVIGDSTECYFGTEVAGGDFNNDGYSDVAISGYRFRRLGVPTYIELYLGGSLPDTIPDLILDESQVNFPVSPYIKMVGDVNSDGFQDLCMNIGGRRDTAAYVFLGGNSFDLVPDVVLRRTYGGGDQPTYNMSSAGDINDDGFGDIILGSPRFASGFGEVLVYLGGNTMSSNYAIRFSGIGNPYDGAGVAVGSSGDVNGDHIDDIMFGAWNGDPGSNNYHGRLEIFSGDSTLTGILDPGTRTLPSDFRLFQNYPNPFNGETTIKFAIPSINSIALQIHVSLRIYDLQGKEVRHLLNDVDIQTGAHEVRWDATDNVGQAVSSGVYFYQLIVNNHSLTQKLILIR